MDASTGSVHDNSVGDSKGWVVASAANLTFTNNTFGTNIGDIAIICGTFLANPTDTCPDANNYTDILAMSNANNGAVVEQQTPVKANAMLSVAYVDSSAAAGGNGTKATPYQDIASAVNRTVAGGTVHVAAGATYAAGVTLDKSIMIKGASIGVSANNGTTVATRASESVITSGSPAFTVTTNDAVTIDGFTFNGTGSPISSPNGNASQITFKNNVVEATTGYMYFANTATLDFENNYLTNLETLAMDATSEGLFFAGNWNGTTGSVATFAHNVWENAGNTGMNLSNVSGTITGNVFKNVPMYGILLANNSSSMTITGNTFDGITNPDAAVSTYGAGIRFYTPSFTGPVSIKNNSFKNSVIGIGVRSPATLDGMNFQISENSFVGNTFGVKSDAATSSTFNMTKNYWGSASGPTVASNANGTGDAIGGTGSSAVNYSQWYQDAAMTVLTTGTVTTTTTASTTSSTSPSGVTTQESIPAGTTISGDSTWNGVIETPTVVTSQGVPPSSNSTQTSTILSIEVGSTQSELILSRGARLSFSGQAGKLVGWSFNGVFTPITATCAADDQATGDALAAGADCVMNVGGDLVVWTKHFTVFSVYTETAATVGTSGGGGGGGGGPIFIGNNAAAPVAGGSSGPTTGSTGGTTGGSVNTGGGQVLGASTFNFTSDLTIGSTGNQVIELQKFLIAQGFSIPSLTNGTATYGYFGVQTRAAVAAYQSAHGIKPSVGYFGPLTRAVVNATVAPVMTDAQRAALIASLTAQLQALQAQLAAIIAANAAAGH